MKRVVFCIILLPRDDNFEVMGWGLEQVGGRDVVCKGVALMNFAFLFYCPFDLYAFECK